MTAELLPCPFCKNTAKMVPAYARRFEPLCDSPTCPCFGAHYDTESEAVEAWNTRAIVWPVGSLQWALERAGSRVCRRKSNYDCTVSVDGGQELCGTLYGLSLDLADAMATDWEVCE